MKWDILITNDYKHRACNFYYQINDNEALIFGGWSHGKATMDIDCFDLKQMTTSLFEQSLKERDMITKRPVEVGNWLVIQGR